MKLVKTSLIALPIVAAAVFASGFRSGAPVIGDSAPAFSLPASNGKSVSLDQFKGKFVVLEWLNHGCPYVIRHYSSGNMQATQKWATENGAVWLSIISSAPGKQGHMTAEQAEGSIKEHKQSVNSILLDPEGKVGKLYDAKTTPHMYVIDPNGKLIYMGAIDDNARGNVAAPRNHVIEALKEAQAGKPVSVAATRPYGCSVKYP